MATSTPGGAKTNLGLEPNIAGLLCYVPCCIGFVFSVVAVIVEKQSRSVRFHAFQSLLVHGAACVLWFGFMVLGMVLGAVSALLSAVLIPLQFVVGIAFLALMIFLMIKANGGEEFELPTIGRLARQWV